MRGNERFNLRKQLNTIGITYEKLSLDHLLKSISITWRLKQQNTALIAVKWSGLLVMNLDDK